MIRDYVLLCGSIMSYMTQEEWIWICRSTMSELWEVSPATDMHLRVSTRRTNKRQLEVKLRWSCGMTKGCTIEGGPLQLTGEQEEEIIRCFGQVKRLYVEAWSYVD